MSVANHWLSSDHHFYHKRAIEFNNRPFSSVEEMNETIIKNHNELVAPGDICYFLGDFSFGNKEQTVELINRLNGQIHLILGNHDKYIAKNINFYRNYFSSISYKKTIRIENILLVMDHFPSIEWEEKHYGSVMLHGHCHGSLEFPYDMLIKDVGVDPNSYVPRAYFGDLKEFFDEKRKELAEVNYNCFDHHRPKERPYAISK